MLKKLSCIILQSRKFGDSGLILVLFSREMGKISVLAKGALRPKSKFHGILQVFNHLDLEISYKDNRELQILRSAELQSTFKQLPFDLDKTNSALIALEFTQKSLSEQDPHDDIYDLLSKFLETLDKNEMENALLIRYLYRLVDMLGFGLSLTSQRPMMDISINNKTLSTLKECSYSKIRLVSLPKIDNLSLKEVCFFFLKYLSYHFEKNFKINSLSILDY